MIHLMDYKAALKHRFTGITGQIDRRVADIRLWQGRKNTSSISFHVFVLIGLFFVGLFFLTMSTSWTSH